MTTPVMITTPAATTAPVMTPQVTDPDQLGSGWPFPPEVSPAGAFEWRSGTTLVRRVGPVCRMSLWKRSLSSVEIGRRTCWRSMTP